MIHCTDLIITWVNVPHTRVIHFFEVENWYDKILNSRSISRNAAFVSPQASNTRWHHKRLMIYFSECYLRFTSGIKLNNVIKSVWDSFSSQQQVNHVLKIAVISISALAYKKTVNKWFHLKVHSSEPFLTIFRSTVYAKVVCKINSYLQTKNIPRKKIPLNINMYEFKRLSWQTPTYTQVWRLDKTVKVLLCWFTSFVFLLAFSRPKLCSLVYVFPHWLFPTI